MLKRQGLALKTVVQFHSPIPKTTQNEASMHAYKLLPQPPSGVVRCGEDGGIPYSRKEQ